MTSALHVADRVWRPYDDDPLITQDMIVGLNACEPAAREALLAHLAAVIAHRTTPVHTTVAFNAVYFGYDVEAGGYVGGPLDFEDFPSVALGDRVEALPVGAMINIRTGGDLLPAEIVYKEGAHSDLGPYGETPGWVSGAPAGARGAGLLAPDDTPVLRERLVFDTAAFGQDLAPRRQRLQRLRRQRRTDDFGHLLVEAQYNWADADLSDADYYARYLVTRGRDQLTSALVPTPLPTLLAPRGADAELLAAVRGLMSTLRQALAELTTARIWGDYAFTRASLDRRLADPGPLGRDDLARLADSTVRHAIPRAGRRTRVLRPRPAYTALGAALRSHPEWQDQLHGTAYPLAVCHANSAVSDCARREQDGTTGLFPTGVRLSLDDRWQGGGVWRAEFVESATDLAPPTSTVDKPAGRGWADSLPHRPDNQAPPSSMPTTPPYPKSQGGHYDRPGTVLSTEPGVDAAPATSDGALPTGEQTPVSGEETARPPLWPDDSNLGCPIDLAANDSQIEWAQPLRVFHVLQECLPLPDHVAAELLSPGVPEGAVRIVLHHEGRGLATDQSCHDACVTVDRQRTRLDGVEWPLDLFPGIWLTFTWQRGSRVIHARTTLLPQPVTVDGELVEHRYDPRVLTRDGSNGLNAGTEPTGEIVPAHRAMTTVQLLTAIRRLGLLDRFGCALLAREDLPAAVRAVTGEDVIETAGIETVLTELLGSERLTVTWGSRGVDGGTHHPPRQGEPTVELVCYRPHRVDVPDASPAEGTDHVPSASADRAVREHNVAGFLRRIGHLRKEATPEQRALYREDHRRFRLAGPAELPEGFTYVRPHKRSR